MGCGKSLPERKSVSVAAYTPESAQTPVSMAIHEIPLTTHLSIHTYPQIHVKNTHTRDYTFVNKLIDDRITFTALRAFTAWRVERLKNRN